MKLISILFLSWIGACSSAGSVINAQQPVDQNLSAGKAQQPKPAESSIYFKANGFNPVWSLTISQYQIAFKSQAAGFGMFNSPHAEPVRAMDSNVKKYILHTEEGRMEIELFKMLCENEKTGERFSYAVTVSIQRGIDSTATRFNGCGTYITDPNLEAKWILSAIASDTVTAGQFNDTLPYLNLYARGNSFEGYGGCNIIRGRIFSERSLLRFTDLNLTKRKCATISKEEEFTNALQFSTQYTITADTLVLSNHAGVTLVFKKSG